MTDRKNETNQAKSKVGGEAEIPRDQIPKVDSVDRHTHGAHGRGRGEEKVVDPTDPAPDETRGSDRGGSAAWGHAPSGGSVIDKRTPGK